MIEDEYYSKYLNNKLELVFNDNGNVIEKNPLYVEKRRKNKDLPNKRYEVGKRLSKEEMNSLFPQATDRDKAVRLDNGVVGVTIDGVTRNWYFPELDIVCKGATIDDFRVFDNGYFGIGSFLFDKDKNMINKGLFREGYHYDFYSDKYYVLESDYKDKRFLFDMNGLEISTNPDYDMYEVKDQCVLIRVDDELYNFKPIKRYKVLLKDGTLLCNGRIYSIVDEENGILKLENDFTEPSYYEKLKPICKYTGILSNGVPIDNGNEFSNVSFIHDGNYIVVTGKYSCNLFDKEGNKVIDKDFSNIKQCLFTSGNYSYFKGVGKDHNEYLFDEKGNIFTGRPYKKIELINEKYAQVFDDNEYKIIDKNGKVIHNNKNKPYDILNIYNNCILDGANQVIVLANPKLKQAEVVKHLFGYTYSNGYDTFGVKYEPVMLYGDFQALCISNKKELYMYNITDNSYKPIGYFTNVHYNEHFVECNSRVYYPYKDKLLDITEFYRKNLREKKDICINEDVGEILSKEEFVKKNKSELSLLEIKKIVNVEEQAKAKKILDAQIEEDERAKEELLRKQEENNKLKEMAQKKYDDEKSKKEIRKQYLDQMRELSKKLTILDGNKEIDRLKIENLYDDCGDHLEIKEEYRDYLDIIDLSNESFKNVKVSGLKFKGSNATINPQYVYKKDMSNGNYEGVHFFSLNTFNGVNIENSVFSQDADIGTIDYFNSTIGDAIYNDNTRINGKTVEEYLASTFTKYKK